MAVFPLTKKILPGWRMLRRLGNSRLLATSYIWLLIVPVAAKLLHPIAGQHVLPARWLGHPVSITIALPFNWYVFYAAAIAFAGAQAIYARACPFIVRRFADYGEYRTARVGAHLLRDYVEHLAPKLGNEVMTSIRDSVQAEVPDRLRDQLFKGFMDRTGKVHEQMAAEINYAVRESDDESISSLVFALCRHKASVLKPFWRATCAVLFGIGLALIGIVMVQNLIFVIRVYFS